MSGLKRKGESLIEIEMLKVLYRDLIFIHSGYTRGERRYGIRWRNRKTGKFNVKKTCLRVRVCMQAKICVARKPVLTDVCKRT